MLGLGIACHFYYTGQGKRDFYYVKRGDARRLE